MLCAMRIAAPIVLSKEERAVLSRWSRGRTLPLRLVQRAQIVAMAAQGIPSQDIAQALSVSRPTVQLWRERFLALRLEGLNKDAPRPGRIPSIPEKKVRAVVQATLHTTPRGATHWSSRTMAKAQGISRMAVQRIWDRYGLKPHLTKTFKLSGDKHFVEKLYDVVGLYLNPPDKARGLVRRREKPNPGTGSYPARTADEKGALRDHDARLQAPRHDHTVRRAQPARWQSDRRLHASSSTPGIHSFPQQDRCRDAVSSRSASYRGQLRNPQTPAGQSLDRTTSQIPHPLHPDVEFLVESGRALVSRDYRQADSPRQFPQRRGIDCCDRRLPEMSQPKPSGFHLESFSR